LKNKLKFTCIIAFAAIVVSTASCLDGKNIASADILKTYLDSQPANSKDKPIKINMSVNEQTISGLAKVIQEAGKFVSLNLSGSILTEIPRKCFEECTYLTGIIIPNTVTEIGFSAFSGCTALTGIVIPDSVTVIGSHAFSYCTSLTGVTIPGKVTEIGAWTFLDCTGLVSVTFKSAISSDNLSYGALIGDLDDKYIAGGQGTYTRPDGKSWNWTKQ